MCWRRWLGHYKRSSDTFRFPNHRGNSSSNLARVTGFILAVLSEPMGVASRGGVRYLITFIIDQSRWWKRYQNSSYNSSNQKQSQRQTNPKTKAYLLFWETERLTKRGSEQLRILNIFSCKESATKVRSKGPEKLDRQLLRKWQNKAGSQKKRKSSPLGTSS